MNIIDKSQGLVVFAALSLTLIAMNAPRPFTRASQRMSPYYFPD
jgi:hypothetical protein